MSDVLFRVQEHTIPASYIREYPEATRSGQDETLQLHIKQYIPLQTYDPQTTAITIIGAHANGFPKVPHIPGLAVMPDLDTALGAVRATVGRACTAL